MGIRYFSLIYGIVFLVVGGGYWGERPLMLGLVALALVVLAAESTAPLSNFHVDQDALARGIGAVPLRITDPRYAVEQAIEALAPDGTISYYLTATSGQANLQLGTADDADVTINQNYETATAISTGDLNTQTAFMTGKIKVSGNLAKLMMHQRAITEWGSAIRGLEVEY